ncbi:MAG: hypothetical protein QM708_02905 [Propioniciclava sp.]|uniref:hypothetical protein n=1 Tax=Propioniciclava sp. TaxID=2038686 RepID=UPI0039E3EA6A
MTTLLEAAAHHGPDTTGAIVTGLVVFALLLSLLGITVGFGSARPHTKSERS